MKIFHRNVSRRHFEMTGFPSSMDLEELSNLIGKEHIHYLGRREIHSVRTRNGTGVCKVECKRGLDVVILEKKLEGFRFKWKGKNYTLHLRAYTGKDEILGKSVNDQSEFHAKFKYFGSLVEIKKDFYVETPVGFTNSINGSVQANILRKLGDLEGGDYENDYSIMFNFGEKRITWTVTLYQRRDGKKDWVDEYHFSADFSSVRKSIRFKEKEGFFILDLLFPPTIVKAFWKHNAVSMIKKFTKDIDYKNYNIGQYHQFVFHYSESQKRDFMKLLDLCCTNGLGSGGFSMDVIEFTRKKPRDALDEAIRALPEETGYLLLSCISNLRFSRYQITGELFEKFMELDDPSILEKYFEEIYTVSTEPILDLYNHFINWSALNNLMDKQRSLNTNRKTKKGIFMNVLKRIKVFPEKILMVPPSHDVGNRVIRAWTMRRCENSFIRVSFVSNNEDKKMNLGDHEKEIEGRIRKVLTDGIIVGKYHFNFLAYSNSQLRSGSTYMFSNTFIRTKKGVTAITRKDVREKCGMFNHIKNVSKFAARVGQCFSTTINTRFVDFSNVLTIEDTIKTYKVKDKKTGKMLKGEYNYTDGCGIIDIKLAKEVCKRVDKSGEVPSVYQFRYAGFKGVVVAYDINKSFPKWKNLDMVLRKSQRKFHSDHFQFEVIRVSNLRPCFLNRQIIAILSSLGVKDSVFMNKQKIMLKNLDNMLKDKETCRTILMKYQSESMFTRIIIDLIDSGFNVFKDTFIFNCLKSISSTKRMEVKQRARIFVDKGAQLFGVCDETNTLEYGQCFFQLKDLDGKIIRHKGKTVVAKNPALHPGDVRVLDCVYVKGLSHIYNAIVFPVKGKRPHPNECSGSDLDGDIYFVSYDPELVPNFISDPMDYTPAPSSLENSVGWNSISNFFIKYLKNNTIGTIANAHLARYAFAEKGVFDEVCLELARKHSVAVDFAKTNVKEKLSLKEKPKVYPLFMEKPNKRSEKSDCIIEKLFLNVSIDKGFGEIKKDKEVYIDEDLILPGYEKYQKEAEEVYEDYCRDFVRIQRQYGIKKEECIFTTQIMKMIKTADKVRKLQEQMKELERRFRGVFLSDSSLSGEELLKKASSWYVVAYKSKNSLYSFPWLIFEYLCMIKRKISGTFSKKTNHKPILRESCFAFF